MNLDAWIATIRRGERHLREGDLKKLCRYVCSIMCEESNVHVVQAPVTVCGDIHGQFYDLLTLFKTGGEVEQGHSYIFMGDFVDRGFNSLETFTLLMLLKARWPDRITLLRGNHESRQVTVIYGFWDECNRKYGSPDAWRSCTDVFDCLNIAALVEGRVFCLHGGLSPLARSIDVMRCIQRKQEIPTEGLFCDLMWSDPDEQVDTWSGSPRGAGWLFGQRVTQEFNRINKLSLVCRAHQLVQDGYKYAFSGEELVTVWSAPNYCYRCGNEASILHLDDKLERHFKTFVETAPQYNQVVAQRPSYFL